MRKYSRIRICIPKQNPLELSAGTRAVSVSLIKSVAAVSTAAINRIPLLDFRNVYTRMSTGEKAHVFSSLFCLSSRARPRVNVVVVN